jgi:glycosyltransferase involved in cell wall biosynthesis
MLVFDDSILEAPFGAAKPPTVLQVIPKLVTGGAERGCVDTAIALARAGGTPIVASEGGPMVHELTRAGIRHVVMPLASKNPFVMRANRQRLGQLIREAGVNIVHARSRAPAWSAYGASQDTGARFLTTFHAPYNAGSWLKKKYNSVMAKGERVIAISDYVAQHIINTYTIPHERIRVVPRGVDVDALDPDRITAERVIRLAREWQLPDDRPIVLMPARLTRWKGHSTLIEAVARLAARRDMLCLIVGSEQGRDAYRRELEDRIRRNHLATHIRLVGECRDMPAAYKLADLVVHASTDPEGFGRVIAEAQAMGRPVIATNIGAPPEVVAPGGGWLVPPGDANALAEALTAALDLPADERAALAQRARAHVVANFTRQQMCAATMAVLAELTPA